MRVAILALFILLHTQVCLSKEKPLESDIQPSEGFLCDGSKKPIKRGKIEYEVFDPKTKTYIMVKIRKWKITKYTLKK